MAAEQGEFQIYGREVTLATGAKVFGACHKSSIVWKFTSKDGAITHVTLSRQAVAAMVHVYQGLVGCDPEFAAVEFEAPADSASGDGQ